MRVFSGIEELPINADDAEMQILSLEEVLSDSPVFPRADLTVVPNESEIVFIHENLQKRKAESGSKGTPLRANELEINSLRKFLRSVTSV